MASLRDIVKDYQDELRTGIVWVAFWKEGDFTERVPLSYACCVTLFLRKLHPVIDVFPARIG